MNVDVCFVNNELAQTTASQPVVLVDQHELSLVNEEGLMTGQMRICHTDTLASSDSHHFASQNLVSYSSVV